MRTTDTTKHSRKRVGLEADVERDESDPHRHKWTTTARLGLLSGSGPNLTVAMENLEDELRAIVACPEAVEALAAARLRAYQATQPAPPAPPTAPFEPDDDVEVCISGVWVSAVYEGMEGSRHKAWVAHLDGLVLVERTEIRAVNR